LCGGGTEGWNPGFKQLWGFLGEAACPGEFHLSFPFCHLCRFFPSPVDPHSLRERSWLFYPERVDGGRITPEGSYVFKEATFVEALGERGYETVCIGGVNFFSKKNEMGKVFPGYFKKSYWRPLFGCTEPESARHQVDFAIGQLNQYSADQRIFLYINFSAIHYPNCHYVPGKQTDDKESHAAAFRSIDRELPRLFEAFRKRSNTLVIALSDHGTCYGEDGYEKHGIAHEVVYTVPYKHFMITP